MQKQPPDVLFKKSVLKYFTKFTGKHLCQSLFFNKVFLINFIKNEAYGTDVCEISKNTFFTEHLASVTPSDLGNVSQNFQGLVRCISCSRELYKQDKGIRQR